MGFQNVSAEKPCQVQTTIRIVSRIKLDIYIYIYIYIHIHIHIMLNVERSGSGVELQTLDYENPGSNPGCGVKTLGKFFHSTLLQFTQLFK